MMPSARIHELAEAIADGSTPDWDSASSNAADENERQSIEQLRAVSMVAGLFTRLTLGSGLQPRHELLAPGAYWGNLRILERVGHGRFGDVYRAWDPVLDREVALKLLSRGGGTGDSNEVIEEGRLMARVRHPNVVAIHGAQRVGDITGLWMEFIEGKTLAAELAEGGPFDAHRLTEVATQLCSALHAVHGAGLVHRDVKPQNVLRDTSGRLVLGDFGTGRETADAATAGGALAGTPMYVAPEIFAGQSATPQSDLYSLGVLLFHLATGTFPVAGGSLRALKAAHDRGQRKNLRDLRPDLPPALVSAIERALAATDQRFDTAAAMRDAFERWRVRAQGALSRTRRLKVAVAATAAAVALAALIAFLFRPEPVIPFTRGDYLVVTSFENTTGEADLDVIGDAFQLALQNSTRLNVMQAAAVSDLLRQVRPANDRVDLQAAQAMAARAPSIRMFLTGEVKPHTNGYAITARLVRPDTTVVAAFEASAPFGSPINSVGELALLIRRRFGEHVSWRATDGRRVVSTDSAAALRLYLEATRLMRNGPQSAARRATARGLLEQALAKDPAFAIARVAVAQVQISREDAATQLARAITDAANLESVERSYVTATAWRGSSVALREPIEQARAHERAVTAGEALLALQPDNVAGLELLALLYDRSGRRGEVASLRERVAELVPFSAPPQLAAARHHVESGNYQAARKYIARLRQLNPDARDLPAAQLAWLTMLDAQLAWAADDLHGAAAAADRIRPTLTHLKDDVQQQLAFHLISFYLTLGRLQDAGAIVQLVPREQEWLSALVLSMYDDPSRLRRLLASRFQDAGLAERVGSLWVDAGLLVEARAVVTRSPSFHYQGQLALAEGNHAEAIRLLTLALAQPTGYGDPGPFRAARRLAEALVHTGEVSRAIGILEQQSARRNETLSGASSGYEWLRVRAQLAKLYRLAGRVGDAGTVEAQLAMLLALADPDHPIKRSLQPGRPLIGVPSTSSKP